MIPGIHVLFNFCIWMVWITVFLFLFPRRYSWQTTLLIAVLTFLLYYFLMQYVLVDYSALRLFIGELVVLSVHVLLCRGSFIELVSLEAAIFLISLFADMFVFQIGKLVPFSSSQESLNGFPVWQYILTLLLSGILHTLLILGGLTLRKKQDWVLMPRNALQLSLFPFCQILLIIHWLLVLWNDSERYLSFHVAFPFLICILADILLFFVCYQIGFASAVREKVRLLEEENALLESHYAKLAEDYEKIVQIRKTLSEQWERIISQAEQGLSEETVLQIEQTKTSHDALFLEGCQNRVLSGFLMHRKEEMEKSGIGTDFSVSLPADVGITNPDLICVYGNLLDNAVEACENLDHPVVILKTDYVFPYLRIYMENPYEKGRVRKKRIPELDRGAGTVILNRIADAYDGNYHTGENNGMFIVSMMLKGDQGNADNRSL